MRGCEAGLKKKSFSLSFHGGEIWVEHLDAMGSEIQLMLQKFNEDMIQIKKPFTSSFMAVNLDETKVNEAVLKLILEQLSSLKTPLRKVVLVGLNLRMKRYIKRQKLPFLAACIDDFEKAKEWLIP